MVSLITFSKSIISFFKRIDTWRDKVLSGFIIHFWPRSITPNHLTFLRIGIAAVIIALLFYYRYDNFLVVMLLLFIGAMLDILDGSIARTLGKETKLGIVLDPLADRILLIPVAIYSLLPHHIPLLLTIISLELCSAIPSLYDHFKIIFIRRFK